jgi:hypothetical protein
MPSRPTSWRFILILCSHLRHNIRSVFCEIRIEPLYVIVLFSVMCSFIVYLTTLYVTDITWGRGKDNGKAYVAFFKMPLRNLPEGIKTKSLVQVSWCPGRYSNRALPKLQLKSAGDLAILFCTFCIKYESWAHWIYTVISPLNSYTPKLNSDNNFFFNNRIFLPVLDRPPNSTSPV